MRTRLVVLLVCGFGAVAAARGRTRKVWLDTPQEAIKEAKEQGRPVVLVFVSEQDKVEAAKKMFQKRELARYNRRFIFACEEPGGEGSSVPPSFWAFHRKAEPKANRITLPIFHIHFVDPEGKILYRFTSKPSTRDLMTGMGIALMKFGSVPDRRAVEKAAKTLEQADALYKKEDLAAAARLYHDVYRQGLKAPPTSAAKAKLIEISAKVTQRLNAALAAAEKKAYPKAAEELTAISSGFPFLSAGKKAARELARLRKIPEAKAALDALAQRTAPKPAAPGKPPPWLAVARPKPESDPNAFTDDEIDALDALGRGDEGEEPAEPEPAARKNDAKAWRLLGFARNWIANKKPDKALPLLAKVIREYPDSAAADQAREMLRKLR